MTMHSLKLENGQSVAELFDQLALPLVELDHAGHCNYISPRGRHLLDKYHPSFAEGSGNLLGTLLAPPTVLRLETLTHLDAESRLGILHDTSDLETLRHACARLLERNYAVLDAMQANVAILDQYGVIVEVNRSWRDFALANGGDENAYIGTNYFDVCEQAGEEGEKVAHETARGIRAVLAGKRDVFEYSYPCHAPDEKRWFVAHITRIEGLNETRLLVAHVNVSNLMRLQDILQQNEARFRALTENISDIVATLDDQGHFTYVSSSVSRVLGYDPVQLVGCHVFDFIHPDESGAAKVKWSALKRTPHHYCALRFRVLHRAGEWRTLELSARNCFDNPAVRSVVINARDITEQLASDERIRQLAFYDALTGLPNRALLQDRMAQAVADARRNGGQFAVIFADLDRFKHVNDSLGHAAGDELLIQVAGRLKKSLRDVDTVSRIAGDEFVMVLQHIHDQEDINKILAKLEAALTKPYSVQGQQLHVTASLGISLYPHDGTTLEQLLQHSDAAMYQAKNSERESHQFFDAELDQIQQQRIELEQQLYQAVGNGEFCLHYQPKVNIASKKVTGVEALLRWHHPKYGLIPAGVFIPVAEEIGFLGQLGQWVLRQALSEVQQWQSQDIRLPVAVNVSPGELSGPGYAEFVLETLRQTGCAPDLLELEITERTTMLDTETGRQVVEGLRRAGVSVALDDFGTGYSSLSYLHHFALDKLKIDKSFTKRVCEDTTSRNIFNAVMTIAKQLNLKTTAEGVETREQYDLLLQLGCDEAQGYYVARPLPAQDIVVWYQAYVQTCSQAVLDRHPGPDELTH
jgi:diguanylate cyclase (GGDEF)-like protein/PAS domain S-box-containing protein